MAAHLGSLFKYIPTKYVHAVVERGELLFRSLSYFRKVEDGARGDPFESMHIDRPGGGVSITNVSTGTSVTGDFAFLNRVRADQIYCFCLSKRLGDDLFNEFRTDACVEITNVREFIRRCRRAVSRLKSGHEWELHHAGVTYYRTDSAATANIKDPRTLPFLKVERYSSQDEYRFVTARRHSFDLVQQIVDAGRYDIGQETDFSTSRMIRFRLGSLTDITRLRSRS